MIKALKHRCWCYKFRICWIFCKYFHLEHFEILEEAYLTWLPFTPKTRMCRKNAPNIFPYICINWVDSGSVSVGWEDTKYSWEFQSKCNSSNLGAAVYCASNVTPNVIYQMLSTSKFNCHLWNKHYSDFFFMTKNFFNMSFCVLVITNMWWRIECALGFGGECSYPKNVSW